MDISSNATCTGALPPPCPGFDLDAFERICEKTEAEAEAAAENDVARQFVRGYVRFILVIVVAFYSAVMPKVFLGYAGIAAFFVDHSLWLFGHAGRRFASLGLASNASVQRPFCQYELE